MNIAESLEILNSYNSSKIKLPDNQMEKEKLIGAIRHFAGLCDWQNLGICSQSPQEGILVLSEYLKALDYPWQGIEIANSHQNGACYIKYNTQKMSHLLEAYLGEYRGVLISYQSENPEIQGTFGYFPLDLFRDFFN